MSISKTLLSVIVLVAIILVGCESQSNPVGPTENSLAKKAVYPAEAGTGDSGVYTLWADYTTNAGTVTFSTEGLTIDTNDDFDIRGINIYTWSDESEVPTDRPDPGHADYSIENIHESTFYLELANDSFEFITVHVALENGFRAYAGGDRYPDGFPDVRGQWWGYIDGEYEVWK